MQTEISPFDKDTRTVSVKFTDGDFEFTRLVNACLDEGGHYDDGATAERVAQVALGVAHKRDLGIFDAPVAQPEPATA